ncbi:efflux RND transporter periplasmic adaptor subunit [Pendulispora albinea]|uniref:Efflux RND transporter periplasmic adaptor subunit n=1 Tax=Pendulispora albinea TaxID=2741071 RepID=A0ABZ2M0A9_9BACT
MSGRRLRLAVGLAVAASVLVVGGTLVRGALTEVVEVKSGTLHPSVVARAVVVASKGIADVRPRVDGRVAKVHAREGEAVRAGQLLVEIDPGELASTLERVEAERSSRIASADAELRVARSALALAADRERRTAKLVTSGSESPQALVESRAALGMAQAEYGRVRARRELIRGGHAPRELAEGDSTSDDARRRLERTRIVAPIDGVVLERRVDEGDTVNAGDATLFEIADPRATEVAIEVEESDAMLVAPGLEVVLRMPGKGADVGRARIERTSSTLQRRTIGAEDARIRAESQIRTAWATWLGDASHPPMVPIGKRLEAWIALTPHDAIAVVPRRAVAVDDGAARVRIKWGPFLSERTVRLGVADEQWIEIYGLAPGSYVSTRGRGK